MTIRIVLHAADEDLLLLAGAAADCPPIAKIGDEIIHEQRQVRLEDSRHQYRPDDLQIGLLA